MKRSSRIVREGEYQKLPKPLLRRSHRVLCFVCRRKYGRVALGTDGLLLRVREVIHHLLPCRWLERYGLNPSTEENLISICQTDHGRILGVETLLFGGDTYGFVCGMRELHQGLYERVIKAARYYRLFEFERFT